MVFSAAVHTPAASVYTNYATSAKSEKIILPAFLLAGVIGGIMPLLAGLIGIETLAQYGFQHRIDSYENITALATGINPVLGGLALAAILAAVISSGGPILLSSATMFVRDWLGFTRTYSEEKKLKAYRWTTVIYGIAAALLAWGWKVSDSPVSILDILLFGFAMVVPPAISVGYLIYWKRTNEAGAFWGMVAGYAGGLIWYFLIRWALWVQYAAEATDPVWRRVFHYCFIHDGRGIDPSYLTMLIPLIVVPIVSLMTTEDNEGAEEFYARVSGSVDPLEVLRWE
jgi:Na+/proline symporter